MPSVFPHPDCHIRRQFRVAGENDHGPHCSYQAREKLEKWADDMVLSAKKALAHIKEQIRTLRRQARQAVTLEEQHSI